MKRKMLSAVLAVALVLSLVSCDAVVDLMGKMGNNLTGVDTAQVETAVKSVTVSEEKKTTVKTTEQKTINNKTVKEASTFTYKGDDGEEKELYTVGTIESEDGKTKTNVIGLSDVAVIELPETTTVDLSEVKSVLPPQDISSVSEKLSGGNKEEMLKQLDTPVEDETTKEAAGGTKLVVQAILESANDIIDDDDEAEASKQSKEVIKTVLTNMEKKDTELTMGDVVVLQALTNLICEAPDAVAEVVKTKDTSSSTGTAEESSSSDSKDATVNLLDEANDTLIATAEILNTVSSSTTLFEGIDLTTLMGLLMTSSESGTTEGK